MAAPQLPAANPPLGPQPPNPVLYSPNQVTLVMKEKVFSLTGDSFTVKTADDQDVLQVKGKLMSIHGKKVFSDMQGNELFTLENKMFKLSKSFHAESPHGHSFDVTGHFSIGSSKSSIDFKNHSNGAPVELRLKGDWIDKSASITLNEQPVASINRKLLNVREIFGGNQTYFVTVAPNVDLSLIAAICVCLDERENEK